MLTFGASMLASPLTTGIVNGPMAAGVRSITCLPSRCRISLLRMCAPAEVASNTTLDLGLIRHPRQALDALRGHGHAHARGARQAVGSSDRCPPSPPISRCFEVRITLIIRSVPILPEPMIAHLILAIRLFLRERGADGAEAIDSHVVNVAGRNRDHRPQGAGKDRVAGLQRAARAAMTCASHSAAFSGLPMQAAPAPTETGSPRFSITMPQGADRSFEAAWTGAQHVKADEALSAMVSVILISQSRSGSRRSRSRARHTRWRDGRSAMVSCSSVEVAADHEGDLGLDLRLHQRRGRKSPRHRRAPCRRTACRSRADRRRAASAPPARSGRSCGPPAAGRLCKRARGVDLCAA